ncbi:MAG: DUF1049 domain-containing protein [Chitinispirillaceae bacterium]|nr:DUF1049 domain-containing protein [Chitinispirillaceae bacterium]
MKMFSWILLFIIAFFIALVMVLTFIQPEFKQLVGAQILTYKTRQMPVYFYVIGGFALGLGLGIVQALYTFIRTRTEIFRKNRRIRELERLVEEQEAQQQAAVAPSETETPVTVQGPDQAGAPAEEIR